jgi:hypothetical protein
VIPRDYQLKAVDSLRSGSILCGGVGSGKSFTALLYFWTRELNGIYDGNNVELPTNIKPLYIITTARKRDTLEWEKELCTFAIGTTEDSIIPIYIDSWNNISKYVDVKDAFFIFDEQRAIGSGKWSRCFIKIAKANNWIMLSATPGDTWIDYIPVFIANGFYKNRTSFYREHVVLDYFNKKYPKIKMYLNETKLNWFRNQILVDMNYVKKTTRHHHWVKAEYDPSLYFRVWKQRWNVYEDKPIENVSELFMCLRKTVNACDSRIDILNEIVKLHKKAIVFYNFDYELDILREYCSKNKIPFSEWNGHKHQMIPDTDSWLYLVQYTAGCEGWNCIETDTCIFWSLNYSYKVLEQACGRIDRLNTPYDDLYYYHIYSSSQIDKAIKEAISKKKTFNEAAFMDSREKHVA